jgi:hypothetical protein
LGKITNVCSVIILCSGFINWRLSPTYSIGAKRSPSKKWMEITST